MAIDGRMVSKPESITHVKYKKMQKFMQFNISSVFVYVFDLTASSVIGHKSRIPAIGQTYKAQELTFFKGVYGCTSDLMNINQ